MATYTAAKSVHKTLSGATVDTITITKGDRVDVLNRAPDGSADMFAVCSVDGTTPANPTVLGDDTEIITPGHYVTFDVPPTSADAIVKVIGSGNAYSVIGKP